MAEQTVITMRRPDGKRQDLHGPAAAQVAAKRAERDGWEYVNPPAPEPVPELAVEVETVAPPLDAIEVRPRPRRRPEGTRREAPAEGAR